MNPLLQLEAPDPPVVGGTQTDVEQRETLDVLNPYNGDLVGRVQLASGDDVERALTFAREAFLETARGYEWAAHRRHDVLSRVAQLVGDNRSDLAKVIMLESGKPIRDAEIEVDRCVFTFDYAAAEASRAGGEIIPMDLAAKGEGRIGLLQRFPIGVVVGITPFNTPLNLVAHKVAPALAAGNAIVIKPALETPLVALALGRLLTEAGVPLGMVSVLPTSNDLAEGLVRDARVAMVSFTGSTRTGWHLRALEPRKRMTLELGGNAGVIVHEDADLEVAAAACATGAFNYAGQSCTSVQRIVVHERVAAEFTELLVRRAKALRIGDPANRDTDIGPMISQQAAERAEAIIREAAQSGARLLMGGERHGRATISPAVLTGVTDDMPAVCEEAFAPIVVIQSYEDFATALERVDQSRYGLQAGVFTRDIERIFRAFSALHVGGLMANEVAAFRVDHMPYGGVKDSGAGKEGLRYAINEMTEPRFLVLSHDLTHLASRVPPL